MSWMFIEDADSGRLLIVAVYVDDITPCIPNANWRWSKSCHLIADTVDELHQFAKQIGMRRSWFQDDRRLPHYDLTENRRYLGRSSAVLLSWIVAVC